MEALIQQKNLKTRPAVGNTFQPSLFKFPEQPVEDQTLAAQQLHLSQILENAASADEAIRLLQTSPLAHSDWQIETWEPYMIETAHNIARKWKK